MATRSSTGIQQCTPCSGPHALVLGPVVAALLAAVRAARRERAARRQRDEVRRLAQDGREPRLLGLVEPRQRRQQAPRVRVVGVVEDLVHGAVLDGAAAVHDHDLVGDLGDDPEVVGDEDDAGVELGLHLAHDVDDLRLDGHVERRRGLVGDQHVGVAADRHGDHRPLAHAAGELERVLVDALVGVRDAHAGEQVRGHLPRLLLALALMEHDRLGDLLADLHDRVQARHRVLEDHRDVVAADRAHLVVVDGAQVLVAEHERPLDHLAGRVGDEPHERHGGDGLAGAGLADDADGLAAVEREAHAVDGLDHPGVGEEVRGEVLDGEEAFGHAYSLSLGSVASRRPLPNEMKPKTVVTSARLGNSSHHQLPAAR